MVSRSGQISLTCNNPISRGVQWLGEDMHGNEGMHDNVQASLPLPSTGVSGAYVVAVIILAIENVRHRVGLGFGNARDVNI